MFSMSTSSVTHPGLSRLPFPGHVNTLFREYVYATIDRHILYLLKKTCQRDESRQLHRFKLDCDMLPKISINGKAGSAY